MKVSILIVLDDALVLEVVNPCSDTIWSLNPYCAGRCSSTKMGLTVFTSGMKSQSLLCWTML